VTALKRPFRAAAALPVLGLACAVPMAGLAQPRPFSCIGAEQLEDDVFAIPFNRGAAALTPAARANLDAAAELARVAPERNLCVLGHAAREGGAETGRRLAASRARAVAAALAERGVERDRVRAEARVASFSQRADVPMERSVTIVVLPTPPAPEPSPEPSPEAETREVPAEPSPEPAPAPEPAPEPSPAPAP
jgi:hypothetical protein